jgi:dolichol-phosphate mannosyltransferase
MIQFSFVVPIYNDAYLAGDFCIEFQKVFRTYISKEEIKDDVELIFVNDGSKNDSISTLIALTENFQFVRVIDLSRNFGQHIALSCGYKNCRGNYVGMLNADMQDPPDQIPILLQYMDENKLDIVFGLRNFRNDSWIDKISSKAFNFTLNKLTGYETPLNVTTLRIMNRKFVDAYNSLTEKSRYIPGLEAWLGFKHGYTPTNHQKRKQGKSSYNFRKRLLLSINSIISFSDLPLKLIAFFGFAIAFIGFLLNIFLLITKLFFINYQHGYTSTVSIIIFIGGIQILVIGLAALYIGRILKEVQNRPLYLINEKYNF